MKPLESFSGDFAVVSEAARCGTLCSGKQKRKENKTTTKKQTNKHSRTNQTGQPKHCHVLRGSRGGADSIPAAAAGGESDISQRSMKRGGSLLPRASPGKGKHDHPPKLELWPEAGSATAVPRAGRGEPPPGCSPRRLSEPPPAGAPPSPCNPSCFAPGCFPVPFPAWPWVAAGRQDRKPCRDPCDGPPERNA